MSTGTPPQLDRGNRDALTAVLAAHPFTKDLDAAHLETLADLAGEVTVEADRFVFRHGQPADTVYLVTVGDVALEVTTPGREPVILQTLHEGDVLGWSWLWPPYLWHLDAHCRTAVTAIAIDGVQLRDALSADPVLGCVVSMRIGGVLVDRLQHARDQLASAVTA